MIVVANHENQMCNRLFALAPVLAYCLETKQRLVLLAFCSRYSCLFPNFSKYITSLFETDDVETSKWVRRLNKVIAALRGKAHDIDYYDGVDCGVYGVSTEMLKGNEGGITFVNSWKSRFDDRYILKNKEDICKVFAPQRSVDEYSNNIIANIRKQNKDCVIVGIHIRRGDYKIWREAKYYYDFEFYGNTMSRVVEQNNDKKIVFVITSNENVPSALLDNSDTFYNSKSFGIEDLYLLSKCDYIIGPPSTYSQWSSFYGNKPMMFLFSDSTNFVLNKNFSPIVSYRKFANGKQLVDLDGCNFVVQ